MPRLPSLTLPNLRKGSPHHYQAESHQTAALLGADITSLRESTDARRSRTVDQSVRISEEVQAPLGIYGVRRPVNRYGKSSTLSLAAPSSLS